MKDIVEFDYDKIMRDGVAIHCSTKEQAKNLLTWADSKGLKWRDKDSYLETTCWSVHKELTTYDLFCGTFTYIACKDKMVLSYEEVLKDKS